MNRRIPLRIAIAGFAAFGSFAGFAISRSHMSGLAACPSIGPVPACYVVFAGYAAMMIAMLRLSKNLFIAGWLPVFLLAASGVGGEVLSDNPVCPRTDSGFPQCYYSFGMTFLLGGLAFMLFRSDKTIANPS